MARIIIIIIIIIINQGGHAIADDGVVGLSLYAYDCLGLLIYCCCVCLAVSLVSGDVKFIVCNK